MKKVFVIILFFCIVSHQQSFCPRGPKHHLKRLNAPKHWMMNDDWLTDILKKREDLRKQKENQKVITRAIHQRISHYK